MADLTESIRKFLEEISVNELEERVVDYVVREVGNGRKLEDALHAPKAAAGNDELMLAAARAVPQLEPGAYFLSEIPLSAMWGEMMAKAHRDWL